MFNFKSLKKPFLFALIILPIAAIGGLFVGMYTFSYYTPETRAMMLAQVGSVESYYVITTVQSAVYGFVCAFFGYILSNAIGLLKPFSFTKKTFIRCSIITFILGIVFAMDYFVFGAILPEVATEYAKGISLPYFIASLVYGGVMEEIMMRFFLMSLLAFIIWKVFARKNSKESIPTWIFIVANILAAILFAAGHLPATISLFGGLNALVVFRCFLLNGAFGLVFGLFYRKYGIQYAMLGHFGLHFVSKIILLIFVL